MTSVKPHQFVEFYIFGTIWGTIIVKLYFSVFHSNLVVLVRIV